MNQSRLCVKGRYGFDYASHPHRLQKPLIRREEFYPKQPLSPEIQTSKRKRRGGGLVRYDRASGEQVDRLTAVMSVAFIAIPSFVVALYLLLWLAVKWRWFPAMGAGHSSR